MNHHDAIMANLLTVADKAGIHVRPPLAVFDFINNRADWLQEQADIGDDMAERES